MALCFLRIYPGSEEMSHGLQTLCSFPGFITQVRVFMWTSECLRASEGRGGWRATYRRCSGHEVILRSSRLHCCVNPDRLINGRFFHFPRIGVFQDNQSAWVKTKEHDQKSRPRKKVPMLTSRDLGLDFGLLFLDLFPCSFSWRLSSTNYVPGT